MATTAHLVARSGYLKRELVYDAQQARYHRAFRETLLSDRAGQFTGTFDAVLAAAGVTVLKIPSRSPRANAYTERFALTVRGEVTDRMLIFSERHLRRTLGEYTRHYNRRRPHRALQLQPPRSDRPVVDLTHERIKRRPVLSGSWRTHTSSLWVLSEVDPGRGGRPAADQLLGDVLTVS